MTTCSAIAAISHKSLGKNFVAIFTVVVVIDQRSGIDEGLVVILDRFGLVHEGLVLALDRFGLDEVLVAILDRLGLVDCQTKVFVAIFGLVVGRQWRLGGKTISLNSGIRSFRRPNGNSTSSLDHGS